MVKVRSWKKVADTLEAQIGTSGGHYSLMVFKCLDTLQSRGSCWKVEKAAYLSYSLHVDTTGLSGKVMIFACLPVGVVGM